MAGYKAAAGFAIETLNQCTSDDLPRAQRCAPHRGHHRRRGIAFKRSPVFVIANQCAIHSQFIA